MKKLTFLILALLFTVGPQIMGVIPTPLKKDDNKTAIKGTIGKKVKITPIYICKCWDKNKIFAYNWDKNKIFA